MTFCNTVYRDAASFFQARKKISRIIIPYNQFFKRSIFKITVILLIAFVSPFPGIRNVYIQNEPHLTLLFLQHSEMVLVALSAFVCYLWTVMKVESLGKIHRGILHTHKLLQTFQRRPLIYSTKWLIIYDILVIIMTIVISIAEIIITNIDPKPGKNIPLHCMILGNLAYSVPVVLVHCLGSFFRSCLCALIVQLTNLNRLLSSIEVLKTTFVENLVYTHCLIGHTFKQLNSAQTLPVMLVSSCTFFVVVYNMYDIMTFNIEDSLNNTLSDNIVGATWITFWTSELVVLVILIDNVVDKHEEFCARLHFIIIQDPTGNLGKSNRLMAHLAVRQKLEYSASGFFTVDYKLISNIASSVTTYLVILIQFAQINVVTKVQGGTHENNKTIHSNL